jgi:hypothetical protein
LSPGVRCAQHLSGIRSRPPFSTNCRARCSQIPGELIVSAAIDLPPQRLGRRASVFASSCAVQLLPYMGGTVLVAALVVLVSSIHAVAREGQKALTGAALVSTAAFASLIFVAVDNKFFGSGKHDRQQ